MKERSKEEGKEEKEEERSEMICMDILFRKKKFSYLFQSSLMHILLIYSDAGVEGR